MQITSEHGLNDSTEERKKAVDAYVESMPRNAEDKKKLVECGYSSQLWLEVILFDSLSSVVQSFRNNVPTVLAQGYTVIWFYFILYLISYTAIRTKIKRMNIFQQRNFHTCFIYDMGSVRN